MKLQAKPLAFVYMVNGYDQTEDPIKIQNFDLNLQQINT